jgi:UPF0716 protein FxsA
MLFRRIGFALVLLEIVSLAAVVGGIGFFAAMGLWFLTAFIGGWLIQEQGFETLRRAQASFERNVFPAAEIFESFCVFAAGLLLIMPGFVSDILAFALLVPSFRNLLRRRGGSAFGLREETMRARDDGVIDGVYERVPEHAVQIAPESPEK